MTVSSQTSRIDYAGDGVTAIFPVPFYFLEQSHLKAILSDDATGAETVLVLNTDYTVTGAGVLAGGSITVPNEPAVGFTLTILRSVPVTQETDYVPNDPFPAESHERALDKLTMIIQQQSTDSAGAIRVAVSDPEPARLAPAVSRANQLMGFDSQGNPIAVAPVSGSAADLAMNLANDTDPAKGAGQVGHDGSTVAVWLSASRVPPEVFGAVGDGVTDDAVALAAWAASPIKSKVLLNKQYRCTTSLTFSSDVDLLCEKGATIALEGPAKITFAGALTALAGVLSSNALKNATVLNVTDSAGISAGDTIVIWNPADFSFSLHRDFYRDGEFNDVKSITGTSISIKAGLRSNYLTIDNIILYKMAGITVTIKNLIVTGPDTASELVRFSLCRNLRTSNMVVTGGRDAAVRTDRCYDVEHDAPVFTCTAAETVPALQYGLFVGNSQRVKVRAGMLHGTRHGFTSGGQADPGSVPCRDIFVDESTMSSNSSHAADFHGNTQNGEFRNCVSANGIGLGGEDVRWIGGTISRSGERPVLFTEVVGGDYEVKDLSVTHDTGISFAAFNDSAIMHLVTKDCYFNFDNIEHNGHATCEGAVISGSWQPPGLIWSVRLSGIRMRGFTPLRVLTLIRGTRPDAQAVPTARRVVIEDIDPSGLVSGFDWCQLVGTWSGAGTRFSLPSTTVKADVSILSGEFLSATGTTFNYPGYPAIPKLDVSAPGSVFANLTATFPQVTTAAVNNSVVKLHTATTSDTAGANQTRSVVLWASMDNYQALL